MALRRFNTALQIKSVDTSQRIIEGYAAAIGNRDRVGDIIESGAFDRTLRTNKDVLALIGHDAHGLPVGSPVEMRSTGQGLFTKTRIYPTSAGDDLLAVAAARHAEGKSLGMSIGYRVVKDRLSSGKDAGMTRHLLDVDLVEYSFLASPDLAANPLAMTTGVKAYGRRKPMKVREKDGKWLVEDEDGETRGTFSTEDDAQVALALVTSDDDESKADWSTAYVNNLPDSAFAYIESGGHKDEENKTVPRSLRHYPHHNADGSVDLPHLRNALARAAQNPSTGDEALPHLKRHAAAAGVGKAALERDDAHEELWSVWGAPSELVLQQHKLDELLDGVLDDMRHMEGLGISTKAGRKLKAERLARLKEVIARLQEVVDWADAVERGDDGKSLVDWYELQANTFELELSEVA